MGDEMVPVFRVKDAKRASAFYERIGFELEGTHRFAPGFPYYAFLRRGVAQLHLSEHKGDAPKKSLAYFWVDGNRLRCGQPDSPQDPDA